MTMLPEPGGDFHVTLLITNTSSEPVRISSLGSPAPFEQASACGQLVGQELPPKAVVSCQHTIAQTQPGVYLITAIVTVIETVLAHAADTHQTASAQTSTTG
jgi:hypothetical protein